jgi:hypothetical protein
MVCIPGVSYMMPRTHCECILYFRMKMVCISSVSPMMPHAHCECVFFSHLEGISTLNVAYTPRLASEYIQLQLYLW